MAYSLIRTDRRVETGAALLLDTSISMVSIDAPGGFKRRIDLLGEVLATVLATVKVTRLLTFNSGCTEIPLGTNITLEEPSGSTAVDLALEFVGGLPPPSPSQLLIITDGQPNDAQAALDAMRRLQRQRPMIVRAYHCGPDGDVVAMRFLADLAALGAPGSGSGTFDLVEPQQVAQQVVGLLTHDGRAARG